MTAEGGGWQRRAEGSVRRRGGCRVVSGLFFFPRGGSAQVVRALSRALATDGLGGDAGGRLAGTGG